jgi:RimJ/RimL family protein N-acetyltransferase
MTAIDFAAPIIALWRRNNPSPFSHDGPVMVASAADPQPLGPLVDPALPPRPGAAILIGQYGAVEKLNAARHRDRLWAVLEGHDFLWTYMFHGPFAEAGAFGQWLAAREALDDPYYYAILGPSGYPLGLAALMSIRPDMRVIEIGHILYAPPLQCSRLATEAQYLLARYVFDTLGYRRYEWKCDAMNAASRRAALRLGFSFEGIFRSHMIVKGRNRDTAWYSLLDRDWPARKAAFERWLSPQNFDAHGQQMARLGDLAGTLTSKRRLRRVAQ